MVTLGAFTEGVTELPSEKPEAIVVTVLVVGVPKPNTGRGAVAVLGV